MNVLDKEPEPETPSVSDRHAETAPPAEPDTPSAIDRPPEPDTPAEPDTPSESDRHAEPDTPAEPDTASESDRHAEPHARGESARASRRERGRGRARRWLGRGGIAVVLVLALIGAWSSWGWLTAAPEAGHFRSAEGREAM